MCLSLGSVTRGAATWEDDLLVCPTGVRLRALQAEVWGTAWGQCSVGSHSLGTHGELCEDVSRPLHGSGLLAGVCGMMGLQDSPRQRMFWMNVMSP